MRKFELALHPDKTRLIRFGRRAAKQREEIGEGKPETFDSRGFTHFCTRSRKWGSGARRNPRPYRDLFHDGRGVIGR
jgi:RNA-directed DNA polymerase